jgi:hypothetical protein
MYLRIGRQAQARLTELLVGVQHSGLHIDQTFQTFGLYPEQGGVIRGWRQTCY